MHGNASAHTQTTPSINELAATCATNVAPDVSVRLPPQAPSRGRVHLPITKRSAGVPYRAWPQATISCRYTRSGCSNSVLERLINKNWRGIGSPHTTVIVIADLPSIRSSAAPDYVGASPNGPGARTSSTTDRSTLPPKTNPGMCADMPGCMKDQTRYLSRIDQDLAQVVSGLIPLRSTALVAEASSLTIIPSPLYAPIAGPPT